MARRMIECAYCRAPVWVEQPEKIDELTIRLQAVVACGRCAVSRGRRNWYKQQRAKEKTA